MEKYRLVQEQMAESVEFENLPSSNLTTPHPEVRITQQGKPRNYITYAMSLFVSTEEGIFRFIVVLFVVVV